MKKFSFLAAVCALLVAAAPALAATELSVFAAASMNESMTEIAEMYKKVAPDVSIVYNFDSSGTLKTQIEQGAECDIFISAGQKQMDQINDSHVMPGTRFNIVSNKVVLIVPKEAGSDIASFQDLLKAEMIALGDPDSVPAGQYAREVLTNLGIWEALQGKISFGTNVTEVLNWVAEGSADCGIVYATDAAATDRVTVVSEAPEGSLDTPVVYPAALLKQTEVKNTDAAELFFEYILSDEAYSVFAEYGFTDHRSE